MEASIPSEAEIIHALRLFRSARVGARTYHQLIELYGNPEAAIDAVSRMGGKIKLSSEARAVQELEALRAFGAEVVLDSDERYPEALAATEDAPPLITVKGNLELLNQPCVAMVGARNASMAGARLAGTIAKDLGKAGCTVVSGLARGIDTAAHKASVGSGAVAVIAGGIDSVYPPENKVLQQQLYEEGLVIAEMPFGAAPKAEHFPKRNRIISGLSQVTAVVEATLRSGSLITARMALEQGRDVFAVPGSPLDPRAEGPNRLIKQGAYLLESAADILEHIQLMPKQVVRHTVRESIAPDYEGEERSSLNEHTAEQIEASLQLLLSSVPTAMDEVMAKFPGETTSLHLALLKMELSGIVERHPGNRVALSHAG